jgi:hypothetical protein
LVSKVSNLYEDFIDEDTPEQEKHQLDDLVQVAKFLMDGKKTIWWI